MFVMSFMPPTDSMFLLAESREHPMHVGGLQLLVPPDGAGPDYASELVAAYTRSDHVNREFRKRPADPVGVLGQTWWTYDEALDWDYHVRHSAVPSPGRIRELLQLTSRWHGGLLDRHRPLWEVHVVEGLNDGRLAVYSKIHHAMVDGVSALRLMQKSFSTDPDARDCLPPWLQPDREPRSAAVGAQLARRVTDPFGMFTNAAGALGGLAAELGGLVPASLHALYLAVDRDPLTSPRAPRTILNGPVGGARRFAAQSWDIDRINQVAKSSGTTLNDVVLTMVGGALRQYLLEQQALPDEPLTAMVPVSLALRSGDHDKAGNAVGAIVVNLATDRENAATRLEEVAYSAQSAKKFMAGLTPVQILAFSAATMWPLALGPIPGFVKATRPPFNVVVSNVPGPQEELYFNGARLDGLYPASIVLDGQAVNFTLTSRAGFVDFGITGCRTSVPHLQRLLIHLETELAELEKSWG
jgi:WS/DGAT/MGAT family acyltransferase